MCPMDSKTKTELMGHLSQFITSHKIDLIDQILNKRTRHITVVLEDFFQPHNASAAIRSCECFGIQDIHVIEKHNPFKPNPDVVLGSDKWVSIKHYPPTLSNNTQACLQNLKSNGFKIITASPDKNSTPLKQLNLAKKLALCFGTEEEGLSENILKYSDETVHIPMQGFTQSFNVSVSVALCLFELSQRLRSNGIAWQLKDEEKRDLKLEWMKKSVKNGEIITKKFLEKIGPYPVL